MFCAAQESQADVENVAVNEWGHFKAQGHEVGDSLCEQEGIDPARAALEKGGDKLRLPADLVAECEFSADTEVKPLDGVDVPDGWMGLDIGPWSAEHYAAVIAEAGRVF